MSDYYILACAKDNDGAPSRKDCFKPQALTFLQPCPQGFTLRKWEEQEKQMASAGHVSSRAL